MAVKRGIKTNPDPPHGFAATDSCPQGILVIITLRQGNMSLTAQGKALDNGALGDTVRVVMFK